MVNQRTSIFFMSLSLVLLALFLGLFLKNTWDNEVAELRKETGYLFVNSIRGIEGDVLDRILFKDLGDEVGGIRKKLMKVRQKIKADSVEMITFIGKEEEQGIFENDVRMEVKTIGDQAHSADFKGELSVIVAIDEDHILKDSIEWENGETLDLLPKLTTRFDSAMIAAGLPVSYSVINLSNDSSGLTRLLSEGRYSDLASGEEFGVELESYGGYVLKKIWPQILFALLLFVCVGFAFFLVFKNLQAQKRLTDLKNDFIQNVTHELKTPIATVGVAIEAMQDFDALKNPEKTKEYLDISKNELGRLSLLVDKVLRMSLFEKKEPELKLERIDFQQLVNEIMLSMRLQFEKKSAEVKVDFKGGNFQIRGDKVHLSSVIYNLLDNALKYSRSNPKINLNIERGEDAITLKVTDNGVGISTEHQGKIFEKFYRVPSGQVHDVKGHGLGLSYVASVVKKHGGTINVNSQKGEGTTFEIELSV